MDKECKDSFCVESGSPILGTLLRLPVGEYSVKVCRKGAHSVTRLKGSGFHPDLSVVRVGESNLVPEISGDLKANSATEGVLEKISEWLHLYFTDPVLLAKTFPTPFETCVPTATDFQKEVWKALQQRVGFGSTVSYMELASHVNRPKAARAVGSAMKNNPNGIIVPCHRVIKTTSEIGNYNGGTDVKIWLLNHEKKMRDNVVVPKSA